MIHMEEEEEEKSHPQLLALSDSEQDDMDDEDYKEILSPEQPLPLPFQFQKLSRPKHIPPPISPAIAYFHLFFTDVILTLMVTIQQICAATD
jgi:hypothetical protein